MTDRLPRGPEPGEADLETTLPVVELAGGAPSSAGRGPESAAVGAGMGKGWSGTGARASHVWERTFLPWDAYFAVVWIATVLFALGAEDPGLRVRILACALLGPLVPWYLWTGRPLLVAPTAEAREAVRYLAVLLALYLLPTVLVGETRLAAFALVPQCFHLLRLGHALIAVAVINVAPVVCWAAVWRPPAHDVFANSVFAFVALASSAVVGNWIMRIISQSAERAELLSELDASREEVARLSAERGAQAERERLAREIHDTLAQGFTSLLMLTQAVESEFAADPEQARRHLALMAGTARDNLAEARALVAGNTPAELGGSSLADAVRRLAARHTEQTGVPADLRITGTVRALPAAVEVVALRACQEALANTRRHAGPSAPVGLRLDYTARALWLSVRDSGCGFDPQAPPGDGFGLPGLRARAAELGGTADIDSAPGRGTSVTVELPLAAVAPVAAVAASGTAVVPPSTASRATGRAR